MESWIPAAVSVLEGYFALGAVFSLLFVWRGVARIAPEGSEFTRGFKVVILPAAAALWPILAWRWSRGQLPPEETSAHRRASR